MLAALAAWLSGLSLALLALIAAITAFLGWRRSSLFREEFPSLSIELTREPIYADREWTLLVLTARLKNTSHVLVELEPATWTVRLLIPGTSETIELYAFPESTASLPNFSLEPQQEDVINTAVWLPTRETTQPAFAQIVVYCPPGKKHIRRVWERRIYFLLEGYNA